MQRTMTATGPPPVREVTVIPANPRLNRFSGREEGGLTDTAAYARVSTNDEDQINSYEAQKEFYTEKIQNNPDWRFAGMFADKGLTGTSMNKRDDFNRMMRLCRRGKIRLILCKSVSRWARNTVDGLNTVRELKSLGVDVYFEKENIHTLKESSEFLITLFAGFAQAESESLSANVRWGMQKSMRDGKVHFQYKKLLGYEEGEDGKPKIMPHEADIVRRICMDYLAGYSIKRVADELNEDGIASPRGGALWSHIVVMSILTNEKYKGDALLQKTYVVDCISKKVHRNNGELPMYLVKNNHDAIVSLEMWNRVQEEMARRNSLTRVDQKDGRTRQGKFSSKYALTGKLVCGECGAPYKRVTWARNGVKRIVWRCTSRLENGTRFCRESPTLDEAALHGAIVKAVAKAADRRGEVEDFMRRATLAVLGGGEAASEIAALDARREELMATLGKLTDQMLKESSDEVAAQMQAAMREKGEVEARLREHWQRGAAVDIGEGRMREMLAVLDDFQKHGAGYDDRLVAAAIEQVTVGKDRTLNVRMKNGFEVVVNV